MNKTLLKSVREYKKQSFGAPSVRKVPQGRSCN